MKVKQIKKDGSKVVLEATASAQDVALALQVAGEAFARAMGLQPEPNKTVEQSVKERLGIGNLDQIVEGSAIEALVPRALDKRNLIPAYQPKAVPKGQLKRGQDFKFTLEVEMRPEFELSSYEPVDVEVQKFSVDESQVQAELNAITAEYTTYVPDPDAGPDREVVPGDYIKVAIDAKGENGKEYKSLSTEGRIYAVGAGHMPEGFDTQVHGMKAGEKRTFTFEVPAFDDDMNETTDNVTADVELIAILKEQAPEITDEWVKANMPWFSSAEMLENTIRKTIEMGQREAYDAYVRQAVATEWSKRFEGKISDEVYQSMTRQLADNLRLEIQQQGKTWDQFVDENGGEQQVQMMLMLQAREILTQGYALDAIFRHFGLVVSDEDVEQVCHAMNPQADPKQLRQQIEQNGQGFALRESAERYKANVFAVDNANITYV